MNHVPAEFFKASPHLARELQKPPRPKGQPPRLTSHLSLLTLLLLLALAPAASAAQISDVIETNAGQQALRFFSLADESVRYALFGSILLGVSCGLLGSFLVVRKMALVGDAF